MVQSDYVSKEFTFKLSVGPEISLNFQSKLSPKLARPGSEKPWPIYNAAFAQLKFNAFFDNVHCFLLASWLVFFFLFILAIFLDNCQEKSFGRIYLLLVFAATSFVPEISPKFFSKLSPKPARTYPEKPRFTTQLLFY